MDRVLGILGYSEGSPKPEILILYGALAVLVTIFVNWALGVVLIMLKPFTCAAILLAFIRPDLAQNFMQENQLKHIAETTKTLFCGIFELLLKLGEHFRQRFN